MSVMPAFPFLCTESRAKPAVPRPTSPREGAFAASPAEPLREHLRHEVPKTTFGAPSQGRARPYGNKAMIFGALPQRFRLTEVHDKDPKGNIPA